MTPVVLPHLFKTMKTNSDSVEVGSYFKKRINFVCLRQFITSFYCNSNIDNVFDATTAELYIHQQISKSDVNYMYYALVHVNFDDRPKLLSLIL